MSTLNLNFDLHEAQSVIHNSDARFKVVAAGRRFGKSHYAAVMCIAECLKSEHTKGDGTVVPLTSENEVWYIAPFFKQAKDIFEEKIKTLGADVIQKYNATEGVVTFINGRKLKLKGADNEQALGGIGLSYVILDEYADMPPNVWSEIIRPTLMDVEGGAMFIGTPKGRNHFYEIFCEAEADESGEWKAFTYTSYENTTIREQEIKTTEADQGGKSLAQQEIHAKFVAMGGEYLDPDLMDLTPFEPSDGYWVITADLAGFESQGPKRTKKKGDHSAICLVKVHTGGWWVKEIDFGRWDVRETAVRLARLAVHYNVPYVGVEKGISRQAVEPYFQDYTMKILGRPIMIQDLTHGNVQKESRIEWSLAGRLKQGQIQLNAESFGQDQWVMELRQEMSDFPDHHSKDDLIDALAYVDQMPRLALEVVDEDDYLEEFDDMIGY
jgi:hypothetical protein